MPIFLLLLCLTAFAAPAVDKGNKADNARRDLNILLGLPDEADDLSLEEISDEVLAKRYRMAVTLYKQGLSAQENKEYERALDRFIETLKQLPASSLAYSRLFQTLRSLQKSSSQSGVTASGIQCRAEFEKGFELYEKGNLQEAYAYWKDQIKKSPACTEPLEYLKIIDAKMDSIADCYLRHGIYFAQKGSVSKALSEWKSGLAAAPGNLLLQNQIDAVEKQQKAFVDQVMNEADRLVKAKKSDEALRVLTDALNSNPDNQQIKSKIQAVSKDINEAVAEVMKEISKLRDGGKTAEALDKARTAAYQYPSSADLSALAKMLTEAIEKEERKALLDGSFRLANESIDAGKFAEALDMLRIIQNDEPAYPGVKQKIAAAEAGLASIESRKRVATGFNRGLEQYNAGLYENALKEWQAVLPEDSKNEMLKKYIADAEKRSAGSLSEKRKRSENEAEMLKLAGEAQRASLQKKFGDAVAIYEKALDIAPDNKSIAKSLQTARKELAVAEEKTLTVSDKKSEELFVQGIDLYREGKYHEAIAVWKKVTSIKPDHKKALNYIQNVTMKLEKIGKM
ncbi:MAG: hypothetical protein JNL74_04300 [Fibrobacteres bacterium]|nr:hypothetical protein [Fibrobacterota bacterium]